MIILAGLWGLELGKSGSFVLTHTIPFISTDSNVPLSRFNPGDTWWSLTKCQAPALAQWNLGALYGRWVQIASKLDAGQLCKAGFTPPLQVPVDCGGTGGLLYRPVLLSGPLEMPVALLAYSGIFLCSDEKLNSTLWKYSSLRKILQTTFQVETEHKAKCNWIQGPEITFFL